MKYRILVTKRFEKDFMKISKETRKIVHRKILNLEENPSYTPTLNDIELCRKLYSEVKLLLEDKILNRER
ncbi:MAG: hypothetical protein DRO23_11780 [Thermoprotei archaeon]|nr:MAG: hypothetical protein DRO23_11780 [Thermoprotei archaeon]